MMRKDLRLWQNLLRVRLHNELWTCGPAEKSAGFCIIEYDKTVLIRVPADAGEGV